MSLFEQTKRDRTPVFTYVLSQILLNVLYNLWGSMGSLKLVCEHFPLPLLIALSVVSMEVFAPHKMAEIRLSAWQRGGPGSENKGSTPCIPNRSLSLISVSPCQTVHVSVPNKGNC